MTSKKEIFDIIFKSIDEINFQNDTNISKDINTKLLGKQSDIDSLVLVNLITSIEMNIEELTGGYHPIADERALSLENSPFKTVDTLANYIEILLHE